MNPNGWNRVAVVSTGDARFFSPAVGVFAWTRIK